MNTDAVLVEVNPYKPPEARVADLGEVADGLLYVVAPWKFLTMMIGTAGIYAIYWFYKNWSLLNEKYKSYWPVMRGIFAIFFTHSLFEEIDGRIRSTSRSYSWSPGILATVYVVCVIATTISSRLSALGIGMSVAEVINLALFVPIVFVLYRAQLAINIAEDDPQGSRNSALTPANILWLVLGAIMWLLTLLGIFFILTGRVRAV